MQVYWGKLAAKLTIWAATEVLLGLAGLDNLADYGEFIAGEPSLIDRPLPMIVTTGIKPNSEFALMLAATV